MPAFDLDQWLSAEVQAAMAAQATRRAYASGRLIYCQDDPGTELFRVRRGTVRLSVVRPDGREIVYCYFGRRDVFGESSLIDGDPRPHTAGAAEAVELDVWSAVALQRLRAEYRELDDALLRLVTRKMRIVSDQMADASSEAICRRVAAKLLASAQGFGYAADRPRRILNLSQSQLAAMLGASRQSVNKELHRLQQSGAVDVAYGRILIRNVAQLRAMAQR